MSTDTLSCEPSIFDVTAFDHDTSFAQVLQDLQTKGWSVLDDFFSEAFTQALIEEALVIETDNMLQAGVGRQKDHQIALNARRDYIQWIDPDTGVRGDFLEVMESLRTELNRRLYLGLFDYEAHFARYDKGAFYEKHVDAFKGKSNRVLSTVFYLNEEWEENDGGELVIYDEHNPDQELGRFLPKKGRLAIFLSECFYHEVRLSHKTRYSIAGWFRVNNTTGKSLDPDQ